MGGNYFPPCLDKPCGGGFRRKISSAIDLDQSFTQQVKSDFVKIHNRLIVEKIRLADGVVH